MNLISLLKYKLKSANNLEKIIFINIIVFVVVNIVKVVLFLIQVRDAGLYYPVNYLSLPASLNQLKVLPYTIFTYMFLHEDFLHVLFNMIWLYWFGKLFVSYIGARKLLWVYIFGGIVGGLFYILAFNIFPVFKSSLEVSKALGASASVIAIVVAIAFYIPNNKINLMFIGEVKLKYIALFTILIDFLSIAGNNSGGHIAHLGGAFFGFIYVFSLKKISGYNNFFSSIKFSKIFKRKPKMKTVYNNAKTMTDSEYNFEKAKQQKNIDKILDKISKSGYESLTKTEKEILFNSSNKK